METSECFKVVVRKGEKYVSAIARLKHNASVIYKVGKRSRGRTFGSVPSRIFAFKTLLDAALWAKRVVLKRPDKIAPAGWEVPLEQIAIFRCQGTACREEPEILNAVIFVRSSLCQYRVRDAIKIGTALKRFWSNSNEPETIDRPGFFTYETVTPLEEIPQEKWPEQCS